MASAARKRGWKPTGDGGGAVLIAEAIAELIRRRLEGSTSNHPSTSGSGGISVAPNGYINFTASVVEGLAAMVRFRSPNISMGIARGAGKVPKYLLGRVYEKPDNEVILAVCLVRSARCASKSSGLCNGNIELKMSCELGGQSPKGVNSLTRRM